MISMNLHRSLAVLGIVAGLYAAPTVADTVDVRAFENAHAEFLRAVQGESRAAADAVESFGALVAAGGDNPLLLAYHGSAETLRGRDAWMPWNKVKHVEAGLDTIDRALKLLTPAHDAERLRGVPVSVETKLVAARTFLALPKFFNRREQGQRLVADTIASATFAATPEAIQAQFRHLAAETGAAASTPPPPAGR